MPLVLDPMMAKMAEKAGHKALYLGGGAMGYQRVYLEANLTLTEMAQMAVEIRTVCDLPLVFDAAAGWGDPMHMHRTMGMAEAAGFAAIEIEDQIPAQARAPSHRHRPHGSDGSHGRQGDRGGAGAAQSRPASSPAPAATRSAGLEDAVRRCAAYQRAGADSLLVLTYTQEAVRFFGERLPHPLVTILRPGGLASSA